MTLAQFRIKDSGEIYVNPANVVTVTSRGGDKTELRVVVGQDIVVDESLVEVVNRLRGAMQ
jgi:hypothetical protein